MANRILRYKLLLCFFLMLVNLAKASEDTAQVMGSLLSTESKPNSSLFHHLYPRPNP